MAQASEFYVPNGNTDRIVLTTNGHPDIRGWSDRELVNTKVGWISLGIASSSLLLGERMDHMGDMYPIPQTIPVLYSQAPKQTTCFIDDFQ